MHWRRSRAPGRLIHKGAQRSNSLWSTIHSTTSCEAMTWGMKEKAGDYSKIAIPARPASMRSLKPPVHALLIRSWACHVTTGNWKLGIASYVSPVVTSSAQEHAINVCSYSGNMFTYIVEPPHPCQRARPERTVHLHKQVHGKARAPMYTCRILQSIFRRRQQHTDSLRRILGA